MTVTNKTSVALEILGGSLKPNESREYTEMMFNTLDVNVNSFCSFLAKKYVGFWQRFIRGEFSPFL